MMIQRILEGQKYVTISFVPYLISVVRKQLQDKAVNARSEAVRTLAVDMLEHRVKGLNTYWGSGEEDTPFDENENVGRGNRQKGFPRNTLLAAALDPRSKTLKGMDVQDKNKIWNEIKKLMQTAIEEQRVDGNDNLNQPVVAPVGMRQPMVDLFNGIGNDVDMALDNANSE